jgi:hypothetical protein
MVALMPKRKLPPLFRRLPTLPQEASSQDLKAWRDQAWQIAEDEVAKKYGSWVVAEAWSALGTGRGLQAFEEARHAVEYASDMDGEEEFEEFWRRFLLWLEPYINEEIGWQTRAKLMENQNRRGKFKVAPGVLRAAVIRVCEENETRGRTLPFTEVRRAVAEDKGCSESLVRKALARGPTIKNCRDALALLRK